MRETDWIVGMPTLAMTGFEHHIDNPAGLDGPSLVGVVVARRRHEFLKLPFCACSCGGQKGRAQGKLLNERTLQKARLSSLALF
jgi:hypothetical protein